MTNELGLHSAFGMLYRVIGANPFGNMLSNLLEDGLGR